MGQKWDNNDHKSRKNGPNDPKKGLEVHFNGFIDVPNFSENG